MNKILMPLSFIVVVLGVLMAILFSFWSLYPYDVFEIKKLPVPVTEPENIKSGRLIFLDIDFCKYMDVEGKVERFLVSEREVIALPSYTDGAPKGCQEAQVPILLPYTILAQEFRITYKATYQVNPIRTVVEEFETKSFVIKPIVELPVEGGE